MRMGRIDELDKQTREQAEKQVGRRARPAQLPPHGACDGGKAGTWHEDGCLRCLSALGVQARREDLDFIEEAKTAKRRAKRQRKKVRSSHCALQPRPRSSFEATAQAGGYRTCGQLILCTPPGSCSSTSVVPA